MIPPGYSQIGGELAIAGLPVSALVAEAGGTPLFVYDRAIVAARIARLRAELPGEVQIHYAIKANPMPALVGWMVGQVDGLDVASAGELAVALSAGADPRAVSFAGPGKRDAELEAAIAAGVTINLESERELERAAVLAHGRTLRVAVRVNPTFELKASGMRMGGGAKPFGVDAERVPALLARIGELGATFAGFHVYSGSQNLSAEALIEAQAKTVALIAELAAFAPGPVAVANIGGGFGIPYFPNDRELDVEAIGAALGETLAVRPAILSGTRFVIELGRYLVGEAGVYLTRIVDRKVSHGEIFLICDGGLHHQLAATGNLGTFVRRNYPIANASRFAEAGSEVATVCGPLCTPLDRLGERLSLPESREGDIVAVFMAGAYGLTASPVQFLGHPAPIEMLL